jgi:hypothetical protein
VAYDARIVAQRWDRTARRRTTVPYGGLA